MMSNVLPRFFSVHSVVSNCIKLFHGFPYMYEYVYVCLTQPLARKLLCVNSAWLLTHSLLHMTSWGSYSDLHVDRSMAVIQAALADCLHLFEPHSTRSARWVSPVWGRKDSTGNVNADLQGAVRGCFRWETTDMAKQGMTTVGYYKRQILETSLLTDCVFDVVEPLNAHCPIFAHAYTTTNRKHFLLSFRVAAYAT